MPGPLTWILELYDKVSEPAEKMAKATEHFDHAIHKAHGNTEKLGKAQKELSAERIAIMTEAAHLGAEAVEELAEKVIEFGEELLHASDYARTTGIIFESLAGSSEGGRKLFENAEEYASKAGIKIQDAVDIFRTFAAGGLKDVGQNFSILAQAAGDIGLKTKSSATQVAQVFADIESKGQFTGLQLRAFVGAIPMEQLAKRLGIASGSFHDLQEELNKNPISAHKGIQAVLDVLQKTEGGTLGDITKRVGEGFAGMSNRVANSWDKALEHFEKTDGFERVLKLMERLASKLEDPAFGKSLSELATSMVRTAEALAKIVPSLDKLYNTTAFVSNVSNDGFWSAFVKRFHELNANTFGNAVSGASKGEDFKQAGKSNAEDMNKGFAEGIEAHSPSKVYERFGRYSAEGFNIGYEAKRNDALGVPSATPAPSSGHTSSTGRPLALHQEIHIHGVQGMDMEALARRVVELSATELQSPLESLAISLGTM